MYQLSNEQIDFILNDIRARGVEMESLQNDLLDHVCCIIEQNLEASGNFENFYNKTIQSFYRQHLWEIEEETITLLTFKNYYTMKKLMIISGSASALFLSVGLFFKFMHWPGAALFIILGITLASLLFMPLAFTIKIKEKQSMKDKLVLGLGSLVCSALAMHVLFKVMHWPFANLLGVGAMSLLILVFLPLYFFSGIRNAETKVNTIVSSVLIVLGCGLVLTLVRSPKAGQLQNQRLTATYLRNEKLLGNERLLLSETGDSKINNTGQQLLGQRIDAACEELKRFVLENETGSAMMDKDYFGKELYIQDLWVKDFFESDGRMQSKLQQLSGDWDAYLKLRESELPQAQTPLFARSVSDLKEERSLNALTTLVQMQLFVLQNQKMPMATR